MINLKELESRLDRALENETKEGLQNWLLNKRLSSYLASIGTSNITELTPENSLIKPAGRHFFNIESQTIDYKTCSDLLAA